MSGSGTSYRPQIQMPQSPAVQSRFDSSHPQYTPSENSLGNELLQAGFWPNENLTGFDVVSCGGAPSCTRDEATFLSVDLMEGAVGAQTELAGEKLGGAVDPTLQVTDNQLAAGLKGELNAAKTTGGDTLGMKIALDAQHRQDGKLVALPDGRLAAEGGTSLSGSLSAGVHTGITSAEFQVGGAESDRERRIFTAEEVEAVRQQLTPSTEEGVAPTEREIVAALHAQEESVADFEVGESRSSAQSSSIEGKGSGTAGAVVGGGVGMSGGTSTTMERTEAGVVVTHLVSNGWKASAKGGVGIPLVKVDREGTNEVDQTVTLTLTLDPAADAALIRRLEGLDGPRLTTALKAAGARETQGGRAKVAAIDTLALGPLARKATDASEVTYDETGFGVTHTDASKGQATVLEKDLGTDQTTFSYRKGEGVALGRTEGGAQTIGRVATEDELLKISTLAATDPKAFEWEGTAHESGEPNAYQALRDGLAAVHALPDEERAIQAAVVVGQFVAEGHRADQLERLFDAADVGRVEQWPASVPRGAARLAALEAEANPTRATLATLDALCCEVSAATDYTVPTAKSETLERIGAVRETLEAKVKASGTVDLEDLQVEAGYAALATALGRCSAYQAEEAGRYAEVGTQNNLHVYEALQRFYKDWWAAVEAVRQACGAMELPEETWMVSVDGKDRREAFEPVVERARGYHAANGGMAGDFDNYVGQAVKL
jgi:hypothetical protein